MPKFELRAVQRREFLVRATVEADSVDDIPTAIAWEEEDALGDYQDTCWLDEDNTFVDGVQDAKTNEAIIEHLRIDCSEDIVSELVQWGRENNQLHHEVFQRAMHYLAIED